MTYNWNVAITADSGESVAPKVWAAKIEHANSGDTSSSWYDLVPTVVQGRESGAGNEAYWDELMRTLLEHGKLEKLIEVLP